MGTVMQKIKDIEDEVRREGSMVTLFTLALRAACLFFSVVSMALATTLPQGSYLLRLFAGIVGTVIAWSFVNVIADLYMLLAHKNAHRYIIILACAMDMLLGALVVVAVSITGSMMVYIEEQKGSSVCRTSTCVPVYIACGSAMEIWLLISAMAFSNIRAISHSTLVVHV